jgi:hypothetical protein
MLAAAMAEESRPPGHNHDNDGVIACEPAVPEKTQIRP